MVVQPELKDFGHSFLDTTFSTDSNGSFHFNIAMIFRERGRSSKFGAECTTLHQTSTTTLSLNIIAILKWKLPLKSVGKGVSKSECPKLFRSRLNYHIVYTPFLPCVLNILLLKYETASIQEVISASSAHLLFARLIEGSNLFRVIQLGFIIRNRKQK